MANELITQREENLNAQEDKNRQYKTAENTHAPGLRHLHPLDVSLLARPVESDFQLAEQIVGREGAAVGVKGDANRSACLVVVLLRLGRQVDVDHNVLTQASLQLLPEGVHRGCVGIHTCRKV